MQFAHAHVHVSINPLFTALNSDSEDGVRARAVLIHVCGTNRTFEYREKAMMSSEGITCSCNTLPALKGDLSLPLYPTLFFRRWKRDAQTQQQTVFLCTEIAAHLQSELAEALQPAVALSQPQTAIPRAAVVLICFFKATKISSLRHSQLISENSCILRNKNTAIHAKNNSSQNFRS